MKGVVPKLHAMKRSILILLISCALLLVSFQYLLIRNYIDFICYDNPYVLSVKPDDQPVLFCPRIISTKEAHEYGIRFSSNGNELFFTRSTDQGAVIMYSEHNLYGWSKPQVMNQMGQAAGMESCLSSDENELFFCQFKYGTGGMYISHKSTRGWMTPQRLTPADLGQRPRSPSVAANGNLYFSGDLKQPGQADIYVSEYRHQQYMPPRKLEGSINSPYQESSVYVAPDESYLIFDSERPGSSGKSDLYICFRCLNGSWSEAINLGEKINTPHAEWLPYMSPDGNYLFFSRSVNGQADIYWVSAALIDKYKDRLV